MRGARSSAASTVRAHAGCFLAVVAAVVATSAVACGTASAQQIWIAPTVPAEGAEADHPLYDVILAWNGDDCPRVIEAAESLMREVLADVAFAFHDGPANGISEVFWLELGTSARARAVLDQYLFWPPTTLILGEHELAYTRTLADPYVHCLVLAEAYTVAETFLLRQLSAHEDADTRWRLGLVRGLLGDSEGALAVIWPWPVDVDRPPGYEEVVETLQDLGRLELIPE